MNYADKTIVFYDGECGFCNRSVQFILRWEKNQSLYFSSLQSDFAQKFFKENNCPSPDLSTFYVYANYYLYSKSQAVFVLLHYLILPFKLLNIFRLIPVCYRDKMYDFVARNRSEIGKDFCFLPEQNQQRLRFLNDATIE
jgi:predicted DCC family thiol-disulfide oxidoreductase YuxK